MPLLYHLKFLDKEVVITSNKQCKTIDIFSSLVDYFALTGIIQASAYVNLISTYPVNKACGVFRYRTLE